MSGRCEHGVLIDAPYCGACEYAAANAAAERAVEVVAAKRRELQDAEDRLAELLDDLVASGRRSRRPTKGDA